VVRVSPASMAIIRQQAKKSGFELGQAADVLIEGGRVAGYPAEVTRVEEVVGKDAEAALAAFMKKRGIGTRGEAITQLVLIGWHRLEALAKYNKKQRSGGL
jgi:hypothetical protein